MNETNERPGVEKTEDKGHVNTSRRKFLTALSIGLGSIGAALIAVPSIAFILGIRKPPSVWRDVGGVDDFDTGTTVSVNFEDSSPVPWSGVTARSAVWLRKKSEQEFIAFSNVCTHLGCPVRWLQSAQLFMCPCHGGVFYANGNVASGPPPRPLVRFPTRIVNGRVQILASPLSITT